MFITFESTEGAGKGTVVPIIRKAIERSGRSCVHTRQPGGTLIGEALRDIFLWKGEMTSKEEVYLLAVDRKRNWEENIRPALESGKIVICERWNATTIAYQAWARQGDSEVKRQQMESFVRSTLHELGLTDVRPNISIFMDVSPAIGLGRIGDRDHIDRIEAKGLEFMKLVQAGLQYHHRNTTKWLMDSARTIDASQSIKNVVKNTLKIFQEKGLVDDNVALEILEEMKG